MDLNYPTLWPVDRPRGPPARAQGARKKMPEDGRQDRDRTLVWYIGGPTWGHQWLCPPMDIPTAPLSPYEHHPPLLSCMVCVAHGHHTHESHVVWCTIGRQDACLVYIGGPTWGHQWLCPPMDILTAPLSPWEHHPPLLPVHGVCCTWPPHTCCLY